jgi:GDP-L-fucose synthase
MQKSSFLDGKRVWVTGHSTMIGSAVVRRLWHERCEIVLADGSQLDLLRQDAVEEWFCRQRPDVVFLANDVPLPGADALATSLHRHLATNINVLAAAHTFSTARLVNLTTGLSPGSQARLSAGAIGRLATVELTQAYVREHCSGFAVLLSSCVYGPGPSGGQHARRSLAGLFHALDEAARSDAETVVVEGDFLPYGLIDADDFADAAVYLARGHDGTVPVHCGRIGDGSLQSIAEIAAEIFGYRGTVVLGQPVRDIAPLIASVGIESLGRAAKLPVRERIHEIHDLWRRETSAAM